MSIVTIDLPTEVWEYVGDYQQKIKKEKRIGHYSQAHAILAIIREHKELTEENMQLRSQIEGSKET